jgi:AcrR family transcriptional regulator
LKVDDLRRPIGISVGQAGELCVGYACYYQLPRRLKIVRSSSTSVKPRPAAAEASSPASRVARAKSDKITTRRVELAEAALETLAELGYARTSLREIAQNSEFSHGVLHYYFSDKFDLICCGVRYYKTKCATRYDEVTAAAPTREALLDGFCSKLGETLTSEAKVHRLWYDIRAQALYENALRDDVRTIDSSLEDMIWRVVTRYAALGGKKVLISKAATYALLDGVFQRYLLQFLEGNREAASTMIAEVRRTMSLIA